MAKDRTTSHIKNYDLLAQIRQLRSKFNCESTYLRCRAFNYITDDLTQRPYTLLFTLTDYDNANSNSEYRFGSNIFQIIGLAVILNRNNGKLDKCDVLNQLQNSKDETRINDILNRVLDLYEDDTTSLRIIGNIRVNTELEALVGQLSCPLSRANETIVKAVNRFFT